MYQVLNNACKHTYYYLKPRNLNIAPHQATHLCNQPRRIQLKKHTKHWCTYEAHTRPKYSHLPIHSNFKAWNCDLNRRRYIIFLTQSETRRDKTFIDSVCETGLRGNQCCLNCKKSVCENGEFWEAFHVFSLPFPRIHLPQAVNWASQKPLNWIITGAW